MRKKIKEQYVFVSKFKGLKIVIEPKSLKKDERGVINYLKGKHIQFVDGKYYTSDKEEIKFLKDYVKNHGKEVYCVSEKDNNLYKQISDIVKKVINQEISANEVINLINKNKVKSSETEPADGTEPEDETEPADGTEPEDVTDLF